MTLILVFIQVFNSADMENRRCLLPDYKRKEQCYEGQSYHIRKIKTETTHKSNI